MRHVPPPTHMPSHPFNPRAFALYLTLMLALSALPLRALDWLPVTDDDRNATASTIDPDAGAEILYRVRQIDDSRNSSVTEEYIRIKVYDEKGVSQLSKIDIPYGDGIERIRSVEARVITPDGEIINVDKKDFYDREVIKYGNVRLRVRSFSFPGLAPGMIAEYKWRRTSSNNIFALKLDFVSELPTRRILFRIKAHDLGPGTFTMGYFFRCGEQKLERSKDGFSFIELLNVKGSTVEPFMPPANYVHPWMAFYPTFISPDLYWSFMSHIYSSLAEEHTKKPAKLVRETAADITRGLELPRERMAAINDYCRTKIKNTNYNTTPGEDDSGQRRSRKGARSPADVIKDKAGSTHEIQMLFVALARLAGVEANPAFCARKSNGPTSKNIPSIGMLPDPLVAAHYMEEWHFFDPARREVDTGMLHWENEGQSIFVATSKGPKWLVAPQAPVEKSRTKRTARLQLDEEGTLTGDVQIEHTGHTAYDARERFHALTPAKLEDGVRELAQARMPGAEVTQASVSPDREFMKPFVLKYSVRVSGYAEQAGQRLFFQPGFFTKGQPPFFTAAQREYDVSFNYAILNEDDVSIKIPPGYRIEEGSAPRTVNRVSWGRHDIEISHSRGRGEIYYKRFFEFLPVLIPAKRYSEVKTIFDLLHMQDTHMLTLRKDE